MRKRIEHRAIELSFYYAKSNVTLHVDIIVSVLGIIAITSMIDPITLFLVRLRFTLSLPSKRCKKSRGKVVSASGILQRRIFCSAENVSSESTYFGFLSNSVRDSGSLVPVPLHFLDRTILTSPADCASDGSSLHGTRMISVSLT